MIKIPAAFTKCVNSGGKVITKVVDKKKGTYMHICYKDGEAYQGEVKTKKSKSFKELLTLAKGVMKELINLKGYWNDRYKNTKK